jgi:hypothetical protein
MQTIVFQKAVFLLGFVKFWCITGATWIFLLVVREFSLQTKHFFCNGPLVTCQDH